MQTPTWKVSDGKYGYGELFRKHAELTNSISVPKQQVLLKNIPAVEFGVGFAHLKSKNNFFVFVLLPKTNYGALNLLKNRRV